MIQLGSIDAVVLAIEEDAAAEIERIERESRDAAARLEEQDARRPIVLEDAGDRLAAARRAARERVAAEDRADHDGALREREQWFAAVAAEGMRRLTLLPREALLADIRAFVAEALASMPREPLEVLVPMWAADAMVCDLRAGAIAGAESRTIEIRGEATIPSGCVIRTADGRIRYENTYDARVKRFEAIWRTSVADRYRGQLQAVGSRP